jgi:Fe-Mn family superoxide dismutase
MRSRVTSAASSAGGPNSSPWRSGLGGGSGWVVLTYVPRDKRLVNQYAAEHTQAIPGGVPIVALDMYEHAYHIDFGANVKAYVAAFMRNIDWKSANERYEDAQRAAAPRPLVQPEFADIPSVALEEVKAMIDGGGNVQIIDARPASYAYRTQEIVEGATWRDPEKLQEWMKELSKSEPVVVYCAYGFMSAAAWRARCATRGSTRATWKAVIRA